MSYITLMVSAIFINNIVLDRFLGICPFVGVSNKKRQAFGMGVSVLFVVTLSSIITYSLYNFVLEPLGIEYLRVLAFILVIASFVQLSELIIKKYFPVMYEDFGVFLPLITTNCLVLGVALSNLTLHQSIDNFNFLHVFTYSISVSLGYIIVIFLFSAIREKMNNAPVPKHFKNVPIALIVAAIMAIAFKGFVGII